jgi:hypothetical protein
MLTMSQFEDLRVSSDGKDGIQPVPAPYHRFSFSDGFDIVSLSNAKYRPSSGSQMLQIDASSSGRISLGQLHDNPCFRFDFEGISLGCDSTQAPCLFDVSGSRWDGAQDALQHTAEFEIGACPEASNCKLRHLSLFGPSFTNLTSINITLSHPGDIKTWWADDLRIAWTDDDCSVAACRSQVPNNIMTRRAPGSIVGKAKSLLRWAVRG